jgi:hypothetical protein
MWRALYAVFLTPRFHFDDNHGGGLIDHKTGRKVHYFTIQEVLFLGRSFHYLKP